MMSRRFSEEQTVNFVKLYRELEPLWKVSHPHYKKKSIRRACLEKIVEEMNISDFCIRDVMIKIKSLRSTYCQEVNKIQKSLTEEESDCVYLTGLKWFLDMDYIMKNCGNLRVKGALTNLELPENDSFYLQEGIVETPLEVKVEEQDLDTTEFQAKGNGIVKEEKLHRLGPSKKNLFKINCTKRLQRNVLSQRFNEDQTIRFVKLYREFEPLWNVSHPDYKNKSVRIACLEKIIEEMNLLDFSPREAMVKINNLRSTYCQELTKIQKSLTVDKSNGIYQPILRWFPDMDYVMKNSGNSKAKVLMNMDFPDFYMREEVIEPPTETELPDESRISLEPLSTAELQEDGVAQEIKLCETSKQQNKPKNVESVKSIANFTVKERKPYSRSPRRLLSKNFSKTNSFNNQCHNLMSNKFSEAIHELASLSRTLRTHALQNEKVEDECDIVGRHVALQLRELPPASRLQAQLEIQKVLCNCRLNILETYQPNL